jgi:hypothetical protein
MHRANSTRPRTRRSHPLRRRRARAPLSAAAVLALALGALAGLGTAAAHGDENMGVCVPATNPPILPPATGPGAPWGFPAGAGFVFDPGCGDTVGHREYAPVSAQYNSTGTADTVEHVGTGSYEVWFSGLGPGSGVPQVGAVGGGSANRCRIGTWRPDGVDELVTVLCFNAQGAPVDWEFTAQFTTEQTKYSVFGYLRADQPYNSQSYQPALQYSWDGVPVTVQRTGTGRYTVTRAESGTEPGDDLVSAYGTSDGRSFCKLTGTTSSVAYVACFTGATSADMPFTLTYGAQGDLLGVADADQSVGGMPSGYAWIDTTTGLTPDPTRRFVSNGSGSDPASGWSQSFDSSTGIATVTMPLNLADGIAEVVAAGQDDVSCSIAGDWSGGSIPVACRDGNGSLVQEPFEVTFDAVP